MKIPNELAKSDFKVTLILLFIFIILYIASSYLKYAVNNQINLNDRQIKITRYYLSVAKFFNLKCIKYTLLSLLIGLTIALVLIFIAYLLLPLSKDTDISTLSLLIVILGIIIKTIRDYLNLGLVISKVEEYLKRLTS